MFTILTLLLFGVAVVIAFRLIKYIYFIALVLGVGKIYNQEISYNCLFGGYLLDENDM